MSTTENIPLRPTVLIVDDEAPDSVEHLDIAMRGFSNVKVVGGLKEAIDYVREEIVDVALLDVKLREDDPSDRSGLALAEQLGTYGNQAPALAPEAAILFISRPIVIGQDSQAVLDMFNRRTDFSTGRTRLAEAYAPKEETEEVLELVKNILAERGWGRDPQGSVLNAKNGSWQQILKQIHVKLRGYAHREFVQPEAQLLRIVKCLCGGQYGITKEITFSQVSKGRSRSLVFSVTTEYQNASRDFRIVKVAARETIEKELRNYTVNVPALLPGSSYPHMMGVSINRDLAGIAYSEIGAGQGLPRTFGDLFWEVDTEDLIDKLDNLYNEVLVPSGGLHKADAFRPFFKRYTDRFQNLKAGSDLHRRVEDILKKCELISVVNKSLTVNPGVRPNLSLVNPHDTILKSSGVMGYFQALAHGDFHPDNILFPGIESPYLIDFAHTEEHHAHLDYIVMEAMMRSQMLRNLLAKLSSAGASRKDLRQAVVVWMQIELAMVDGEGDRIAQLCNNATYGAEFRKLTSVIQWLRRAAVERNYLEPEKFYYAGLGMVCYSFVGLPDDSIAKDYVREVLLFVAALCLSQAVGGKRNGTWITQGLDDQKLDARLAISMVAWRGWTAKHARGALEKLIGRASKEPNRARDMGAYAQQMISQVKTIFPKLCESVESCNKRSRVQEVRDASSDIASVCQLITLSAFLQKAVEMDCKVGRVTEVVEKLKLAQQHLWENP